MESDIEKGLEQIKNLYMQKSADGSVEEAVRNAENIYPLFYKTYKDKLTERHKEKLADIIYTYSLESNKNLKEGFEANAEFITNLLSQKDRSKENVNCFYTKSVLFVMDYYKRRDFLKVLEWAKKLNPELLSQEPESYIRVNNTMGYFYTDMEKWYGWKSIALLKVEEPQKALNFIEEAFRVVKFYSDDNKYWFKYRHALSNMGLGNDKEALEELLEINEYKRDWTYQNEIAYCYFNLDDYDNAFKYALDAALNPDGGVLSKSNVYELILFILAEKELESLYKKHEIFLKHIRHEQNLTFEGISDDEEDEEIYEKDKYKKLEIDLRKQWAELRYQDEERSQGKIDKILKYEAFIICDGKIFTFKRKTVDPDLFDSLSIDMDVSFYKNEYYNYHQDKEFKLAVGVELI